MLVEGNPKNYASRGFRPSYTVGIEAGPKIKLPHPDCLMVKELEEGALKKISGWVDYSFYETLCKGSFFLLLWPNFLKNPLKRQEIYGEQALST